jgi:hypothetical protein
VAEVGSAYVSILPSAKGFAGKLGSEIGPGVDKAGKDSGDRFGKVFARSYAGPLKAVGALALGIFAVDKVKDFFSASIGEARESQKVSALTAQVIKTTGGAAHISAGQVGELATAISNKTGIDDEAIQSASNLLLTFKNLRNEVGKGNDIFNQATQIATDMGAALGKDPKAAAIQLGKALNDPVKGMKALTRVGVSFTDQQSKQVQAMVKSGNTLGAQKIILGELRSEFGGAAAASATAGEKFSTSFKNFEEALGTAVLPLLDTVLGRLSTFAQLLTGKLPGAVSKVGTVLKPLTDTVKLFIGTIIGTGANVDIPWAGPIIEAGAKVDDVFFAVVGAVKNFIGALRSGSGAAGEIETVVKNLGAILITQGVVIWRQLGAIISGYVVPALRAFGAFMVGSVLPAIVSVSGWLRQHQTLIQGVAVVVGSMLLAWKAFNAVMAIARAAAAAYAAVQVLLNAVMTANPIGLVIVAIAALVAGLIFAYKHSDTFRTIVQAAFKVVATAATFMWGIIKPILKLWIDAWLITVGAILHGAALAFGWIPGIGPKLKAAAAKFDEFKNTVNKALDGTHSKKDITIKTPGADSAIAVLARLQYLTSHIDPTVTIRASMTASRADAADRPRAMGGPVKAGVSYLVGEKRPEVFVPDSNGRILPRVPSSGAGLTINGDVYGADAKAIVDEQERRARRKAALYPVYA